MAVRTVKEFATILGISPEELLTEVRKTMTVANMDSSLTDESQTSLLGYVSRLQKINVMPDQLSETKSKLE